jgi:hypothetical protein
MARLFPSFAFANHFFPDNLDVLQEEADIIHLPRTRGS